MTMNIENNVYIVTGGSKGFGLAIAESLVEQGTKVGLISRGQASLDEAVNKLGSENALGVSADVANSSALSSAFKRIRSHFGRLDGLINNAGLARPAKAERLSDEDVILQINTNLLGTILGCKAVIPLLRESENPRIINISSATVQHFDEAGHMSVYSAVKAGAERFTRELAVELLDDNIGVTIIRPGYAATEFATGWNDEAVLDSFKAWKDMGRYMRTGMKTKDVAGAVLYALSQPRGVAAELLEIRPNKRTPKY